MPPDTYTLWGYALFLDEKGDYVEEADGRNARVAKFFAS